MDDLLPYYERELATLRSEAATFARQYPKIAGRLAVSGDVGDDPHVERMIESFALLAARVHKRLDDDFPRFTESLLQVLYPHYLRPFPSCSIAQFELGSAGAQMTGSVRVPRATALSSRPVGGVPCKFRTTSEVALAPVRLAHAAFQGTLPAGLAGGVSPAVSTALMLDIELTSPQSTWHTCGAALRVYLHGEASQVAAMREALLARTATVVWRDGPAGRWVRDDALRPRAVGFSDDDALLDADARTSPAYRLLTEFFAFPEKFQFVDLPLPAQATGRTLSLGLLLQGVRPDGDLARLLETIDSTHLLLHCAPVVNLFTQPADPIRVTHASPSYPVLADARRAHAYETIDVQRVYRVRQTAQGERVDEFRPFYSLRHQDTTAHARVSYWHAHRNEALAASSPGYEYEISIVDIDFDPMVPGTDTLSLDVLASNRDLPRLLSIGTPGGDLFLEGGSPAQQIRMLRKPTAAVRFPRGQGALWRLISHLSVNYLSLSGGGLDALREMLRLYDLPAGAINRRQIDSLVDIGFAPSTAWLPGQPFATVVRGMEITLTLDDRAFVGASLHLFVDVLDRFFALYAHVNSFTRLRVLSSHTHEELIACPRRSGHQALL